MSNDYVTKILVDQRMADLRHEADQERLQAVAIRLAAKGVGVLLSNSTAPGVAALYETSDAARRAGLRAWRIPARRAINSKSERRGAIEELLVTNLPISAQFSVHSAQLE